MSDVSPVAELLGQALYHYERLRPLLPTYGHLIVSALFPIWIGSHASLTRPSSAAKPPKKDKNEDEDTEDEAGPGPLQKMEGLGPSDALMLPVTAGLTLGGLYLVIKWLEDPAILNKVLSFYFSQMGLFFAFSFLKDALLMIRSFVFPRSYRSGGQLWRVAQTEHKFIASGNASAKSPSVRYSPLAGIWGLIPLPGMVASLIWNCRKASYQRLQIRAQVRGLFNLKFLVGLIDVLSALLALSAVGYFAFVAKLWWLTNFLGFCFCYGTLQVMSPSTFWTGTLILGALFFYDIYFVFFTPLMVTVATKLDVPIKLLFPRPPNANDDPKTTPLAMLGLGDIVVPGMVMGLALRFDLFLYYQRKGARRAQIEGSDPADVKPQYQSPTGSWGERFWAPLPKPEKPELKPPYYDARSFPKTYFKASVVGYVIGMITTLLAMQYSNHAQPALLYLVPGVLTSLWGTALVRGEIKTMWHFADDEEVEVDAKKKEELKEEPSTKSQKSLLMRLFSGEIDPPASKDDDLQSKKTDEKTDDSKPKKVKNEKKVKQHKESKENLDLIAFSLSLPRKSKSKTETNSSESLDDEEDKVTQVYLNADGDNEPPLKRRRRSVKKPASE
jgi:minor histocompatibility antigen H13